MTPSKQDVKEFIASVRYPMFAAYTVNKLMARFGVEREIAVKMWEEREKLGSWSWEDQ